MCERKRVCMCVPVCVCVRERVCVYVRESMCVCERERESVSQRVWRPAPRMLTQSSVPRVPKSPSKPWDVPTGVPPAELGLELGPGEREGHRRRVSGPP